MPKSQRGYSITELLIALAILGLFVSIAVPQFGTMRRRAALKAAAGELRSILQLTRQRAIARGVNCGVKFLLIDGEWQFARYDDGDNDGVRNDDIASGIETRVAPPRVVLPESRIATIGLLPTTIVDPDGDRLVPTASAVQFNRSTICSFSPLGQSTPGTIYITDRGRELYAVRVYGTSAKIRTLRYDAASRRWVAR